MLTTTDLPSSTPTDFHRSLLTDTNLRPARTQWRPQTQIYSSSSSSSSPTDVVHFLSCQICRLKKKETTNQTQERIWIKKKKNLKSTVVCVFFSCCRWRWSSPPTGKGIGEETVPDPPIRLDFLCGGAWTQAPPAAAARGEDTLPLLPPSKGFSALLLNPRSCTDVPRIVPDFQQQLFLL